MGWLCLVDFIDGALVAMEYGRGYLVEPDNMQWNLTELVPEQAPVEIGNIEGVEFRVE